MSDYNFGPQWLWDVILWLALIGFLAVVAGVIFGLIWLLRHIQFV